MIQMEKRHWNIVRTILKKYPYTFYAFGSRVKGTARPLSDFDICYKESIPSPTIVKLEGDFEDSDLPFKVDLISWDQCDDNFRKRIENDLTVIQVGTDTQT